MISIFNHTKKIYKKKYEYKFYFPEKIDFYNRQQDIYEESKREKFIYIFNIGERFRYKLKSVC